MAQEIDADPKPSGEVLLYQGGDGSARMQVRLQEGTVWLTQRLMAELYGKDVRTVNEHLQNIYEEGEIIPEATIRKFRIVQIEGQREVRRLVEHYSLPAILAVGYRVRSPQGTHFRQWATTRLTEYLVKGFVMDDARLKEGVSGGVDYFDELLERIRDIRASERRFYQKISDIYARCSVDYDARAETTKRFYATVQNKLHWAIHWAIHGHTAAELIHRRADHTRPNMGLTTWKQAPSGPIRQDDVSVAKNYLNTDELRELNRVVTMYLDYAEDQARRRHPMRMEDWLGKLDSFLDFNERNVLSHAGTISHALALEHAEGEFASYRAEQRQREAIEPSSDFDHAVAQAQALIRSKPDPSPG